MSNLNLFTSKPNLKNIILPIDQILAEQKESNNSWQDLSDVTSTLLSDNQIDYVSSASSEKNATSWRTIHDYTTRPESCRFQSEQTDYCRLDRNVQWFLLARRNLVHDKTNQAMTSDSDKHLSKDSFSQPIEQTF
ncbi:unnamed protein product, partial [Rotaria magnacalcarata]